MKKAMAGKVIAASIPYIAVGVGVYLFSSAWIAVLMYHGGIVALLVIGKRFDIVRSIKDGWNLKWAVGTITASSLTGVIIYLLWPLVKIDGVVLADVMSKYGVCGNAAIMFAVYAIIVNPVLEEMLWHGFLADEKHGLSWIEGAFAGYHVMVMPLVLPPILCAGVFVLLAAAGWAFRYLRRRLGGLAVPWAMHLIADISIIAGIYFILGN